MNYGPEASVIEIVVPAELRAVDTFNQVALRVHNLKGLLFGLSNCLPSVGKEFFTSVGVALFRPTKAFFHAAFFGRVLHVVELSTQPKMIWVYAARIIAAVKNHHSFGDEAVKQFIRVAMRADLFAVNAHAAITAAVNRPRPKPALAGLVDTIPKPITFFAHAPSIDEYIVGVNA